MTEFLNEAVLDSVKDSLLLLPFLYLTYLLMEFIEHRSGARVSAVISRAGRFGPLAGGLLGAVPQCGFSAAAASLYAGRIITLGTLIAVFLSTSDEMVAVMISGIASGKSGVGKLLTVLAVKVVCGIAVGFIVDLAVRGKTGRADGADIGELCEHEHCDCGKHGIFFAALKHSLTVWLFILLVTFAVNTIVFFVGEDTLGSLMRNIPVLGELIAGLVGLIPNCAASVVVTELYLDGVITAGQMLSGLFTSAGVGLLVLFRTNRGWKTNLMIVLTLYVCGAGLGLLLGMTGLAGLLGL